MLRLPPFRYHRPRTVDEAVGLLEEHAGDVMPVAGGTDLIPNMKHGLFTPGHLVALKRIDALHGVGEEDGFLVLGAGLTLTQVSAHPMVRLQLAALADAAGHVAGPQLRNQGTLGGNLCLDTRCTYYNQSEFWRSALGYCLKKDGTVCHVTKVGKKCVAAHSADTPPVLMTAGAEAELAGPAGRRWVPVRDFFVADGIWNTRREPGEVLTRVRIPLTASGNGLVRHSAYVKLRQRNAVDFPLLTLAAAVWTDADDRVESIAGVVTALGSRPRELSGWKEIAVGERLTPEVIEALAERAHQQCIPLENIIVDPDWRRAMVPVYARRLLERLAPGSSPAPSPAHPSPVNA